MTQAAFTGDDGPGTDGQGSDAGAGRDAAYAIRRARPEDVATVSRHRDAMFTEMGIDRTVVQAASGPAREWLGAALAEGRYLGLLVVTGGDVVGGVGVTWLDLPPNMHTALPRRGYILNMYVDPPHRGRGLARRLLDGAVEVCRSHGVDVVTLHASDAGRPLYAASGFTATNEMRLTLREEPH